jgi:hypothetical protein
VRVALKITSTNSNFQNGRSWAIGAYLPLEGAARPPEDRRRLTQRSAGNDLDMPEGSHARWLALPLPVTKQSIPYLTRIETHSEHLIAKAALCGSKLNRLPFRSYSVADYSGNVRAISDGARACAGVYLTWP